MTTRGDLSCLFFQEALGQEPSNIWFHWPLAIGPSLGSTNNGETILRGSTLHLRVAHLGAKVSWRSQFERGVPGITAYLSADFGLVLS